MNQARKSHLLLLAIFDHLPQDLLLEFLEVFLNILQSRLDPLELDGVAASVRMEPGHLQFGSLTCVEQERIDELRGRSRRISLYPTSHFIRVHSQNSEIVIDLQVRTTLSNS